MVALSFELAQICMVLNDGNANSLQKLQLIQHL